MRLTRPKRFIALTSFLVFAVAAILVLLFALSDLSYKGHSLAYWLDRLPATVVTSSGNSYLKSPVLAGTQITSVV